MDNQQLQQRRLAASTATSSESCSPLTTEDAIFDEALVILEEALLKAAP